MHTVSLTSLSDLKEIPAAANGFPRPEAPSTAAPVPADQSQTSDRSFYFPCNKLCRPSINRIPGPWYPVTEVYKWQQQPKLQQHQPQQIPSNVG
jgi:hypothetical protein